MKPPLKTGQLGIKLESQFSIRETIDLAQAAECGGVDSIWVAEYRGPEAMSLMAMLAVSTKTIVLGSSIIPIYTRSAPVLAMAAASLEEVAPGRVILGLGTSSDLIVSDWHGRERAVPLRAIAEHVEVIKRLLEGEKVQFAGDSVTVNGFRLAARSRAADGQPPIFLAALGRAMLQIAATFADGVILNGVPVSRLAPTVQFINDQSSERAEAPLIVSELRVLPTSSDEVRTRALAAQRQAFAIMGRARPYQRLYVESGFEAVARQLRLAWDEKNRDAAAAAIPDAMLDEIVAVGKPETVRNRVRKMVASGVDVVILVPIIDQQSPRDSVQELIAIAASVLGDGQ